MSRDHVNEDAVRPALRVPRHLVITDRTNSGVALWSAIHHRIASGPCSFHLLVPIGMLQFDTMVAGTSTSYSPAGELWKLQDELLSLADAHLESALRTIADAGAVATGEVSILAPFAAARLSLEHEHFDEVIVGANSRAFPRRLGRDLASRLRTWTSATVVRTFDEWPHAWAQRIG